MNSRGCFDPLRKNTTYKFMPNVHSSTTTLLLIPHLVPTALNLAI